MTKVKLITGVCGEKLWGLIPHAARKRTQWTLEGSEETTSALIAKMEAETDPDKRQQLLYALSFLNQFNNEYGWNEPSEFTLTPEDKREVYNRTNRQNRDAMNFTGSLPEGVEPIKHYDLEDAYIQYIDDKTARDTKKQKSKKNRK